MTDRTLTLALRNWSYLEPLRDGRVQPEGLTLRVSVINSTKDFLAEPDIDGGEVSFSRYVRACMIGDDRLEALPFFVMRSFRERCILVASNSSAWSASDLRNGRIGLTGWANSGNIWTRAVLRRAGVPLDDIQWFDGVLTQGSVAIGSNPRDLPPNVSVVAEGPTLFERLLSGSIDAVFAPFAPPDLFDRQPTVRHVFSDVRQAELTHYRQSGYIPGIHVLALRGPILKESSWVRESLLSAIERSKQVWLDERRHLADSSPWELVELENAASVFGYDWMPAGVPANRTMINDFVTEMNEQGIISGSIDGKTLFGEPTEDTA